MRVYRSRLAPQILRFVSYKRSLGYQVPPPVEWYLRRLDRLVIDAKATRVDEPLARRFVAEGTRATRKHRLTIVRQFARFLAPEDSRIFIPPRGFLGVRDGVPLIRVLSREESRKFLAACDALHDWQRYPGGALIQGTALRTMLLTGLRRGEIVRLSVGDVDLVAGVLSIRQTKFGKSRLVPLAPDLTESLRAYAARLSPRSLGAPFFPGPDGRSSCGHNTIYCAFRRALRVASIAHGGRGQGPRLHDLRHTFAVLRLLTWYEQGADLSVKLPLLATYLGHVALASSQRYLHMTLDLVGEVTRRFEARFGGLIKVEAAS